MIFVIGDIHGEITKLRNLIANLMKCHIKKLIFVGDYINKGEDSKKTLEYLLDLSNKIECIFLIGNHEYALLEFVKNGDYKDFLYNYGGMTTMEDFKIKDLDPSVIKEEIIVPYSKIFANLKNYLILNEYIISHSGINPYFINCDNWEEIPSINFVFQRWDFIKYANKIKNKEFIIGHTEFLSPFYDGIKIVLDTGAGCLRNSPLTAFELNKKFFIDSFNYKYSLTSLNRNSCPYIIYIKPYRMRNEKRIDDLKN